MDENFVQGLFDELDNLSSVTESFVLPTKGRLNSLPESVSLRMMTTHEEKLRTGNRSTTFWKLMANIINRCVVEPKEFDAYKLTVVDFIFLMYKLRIMSYGKEYKVSTITCPKCEKLVSDLSVDLTKLEVVYIDDMPEKFQGETIAINLPVTKWDVELRMLRIDEFDEIQEEVEKTYEKYPDYEGDPSLPLRLEKQIVSIKGQKLQPATMRNLVSKLPAADENAISQVFEKINMGLNTKAKCKCPRCKKSFILPLSWSEEFFRPTSD